MDKSADDREKQNHGAKADKAETAADDACRCKEVSKKTPRELLRLMLEDLLPFRKGK